MSAKLFKRVYGFCLHCFISHNLSEYIWQYMVKFFLSYHFFHEGTCHHKTFSQNFALLIKNQNNTYTNKKMLVCIVIQCSLNMVCANGYGNDFAALIWLSVTEK